MDKAKQVLGTFGKILPDLSEPELDRLLAFGEEMAFKVYQEKGVQANLRNSSQTDARPKM